MAVPRIAREELKARLDSPDSSSHPILIDVRLKYPYEHSTVTLPGAQRVLPDAIASTSFPRERDLVLYDSDPNEIVSAPAAAELLRRGYRAMVLQGGINEWMNAKLPVDTKSAPQPAAPAAKPAAQAAKPAPPVAAKPAAPAAPKPAPPAPPKPLAGAATSAGSETEPPTASDPSGTPAAAPPSDTEPPA